jgi:hypothetical protein
MELRLEIDELRLDEEWLHQPKMRQIWGEKLADAQLELDEAKSVLAVVVAELDNDIRSDPESHGVKKITESAVSSAIPRSDVHQRAVKKLNKARHAVNVLQAAVDGLEHRKRALTSLVELHGQDYFATPSMPRGVKNKRRERDDVDS